MKLFAFIATLALVIGAIVGYIINFIDVIQLATGSLAGTTMYCILKFVGIIVPFIGAIMGYF